MLTKIKLALAGALSIVIAVLYGLWQREKSIRADEHEQIAKGVRKSSDKATEAIIEGAAREQAIDYEEIDTIKRDHFTK